MKSSNTKADQYGATICPDPAIDFPTRPSAPSYGTKKAFVKPHGGDQYGVTMQKSKPVITFPLKPAFAASTKDVKRGY